LVNTGTVNTTGLVATLQATGGVTNPSGSQNYGILIADGAAVARPFSFIASGSCGGSITLTLTLQDGLKNLGSTSLSMGFGGITNGTALNQAFDGVSAPALPAGWTAPVTGGGSAFVTS